MHSTWYIIVACIGFPAFLLMLISIPIVLITLIYDNLEVAKFALSSFIAFGFIFLVALCISPPV